jgi:hypothetical protein
MGLTDRELWTAVHGMILWTIFLLGFAAGLAGLWNLRPECVAVAGMPRQLRRLLSGLWVAAAAAWAAVLTGTFVLYPWYRARPPEGANLANYPRAYLQANPEFAEWHDGMEWKQQVAWLAPILATAVAYVAMRYGPRLAVEAKIRRTLMILLTVAFLASGVAAFVGSFINKIVSMH